MKVAPRYRGFHRFDLTTCIACEACARACPANCILVGKERVAGRKGFQITEFTIDYGKCLFCALCVEPCPVDCIFMGSSHDLSCYSRDGCRSIFRGFRWRSPGGGRRSIRWRWPARRRSSDRFTAARTRRKGTEKDPLPRYP